MKKLTAEEREFRKLSRKIAKDLRSNTNPLGAYQNAEHALLGTLAEINRAFDAKGGGDLDRLATQFMIEAAGCSAALLILLHGTRDTARTRGKAAEAKA
jgi:hypothetical protein